MDWLNNHKGLLKNDFSELESRLPQFAKVLSIGLSRKQHLRPDEERKLAREVDAHKLTSLLKPLYMTEALYGGLEFLVRYKENDWTAIFEEFLDAQDYVLRYTISEVLGKAWLADEKRLGKIRERVEHSDIGHQEVGYHALRYIIAQKPELFRQSDYIQYLQRLANNLIISWALRRTSRFVLIGTV